MLEAYLAAIKAVAAAHGLSIAAISQLRKQKPRVTGLMVGLNGRVRISFGSAGATLIDFGMKPRRPAKKTAATKRAAAAKGMETRKARHTMGKKQKAKVRGTGATRSQPAR